MRSSGSVVCTDNVEPPKSSKSVQHKLFQDHGRGHPVVVAGALHL